MWPLFECRHPQNSHCILILLKKRQGGEKNILTLTLTPSLSSAIRKVSFYSVACKLKVLDLFIAN